MNENQKIAHSLIVKIDDCLNHLRDMMPGEDEMFAHIRTTLGMDGNSYVGQRNLCEVVDEYDFEEDDWDDEE